MREAGDTAVVMETIGALEGVKVLTQRVIHFDVGRSHPRRDADHDDLLFVVSGAGTVELPSGAHPLEPGTAVHLRAGESAVVDNTGPEHLVIVSVLIPPAAGDTGPTLDLQAWPSTWRTVRRSEPTRSARTACFSVRRRVVGRRPSLSASWSRSARLTTAIPTTRWATCWPASASRTWALIRSRSVPARASTFPATTSTASRTLGPGVMQILGVFHPAEYPHARTTRRPACPTHPR